MGVLLFIGPGPVATLIVGIGLVRCGLGLGGMVNNKLGGPLYEDKNFWDIPCMGIYYGRKRHVVPFRNKKSSEIADY